MPTAPGRRSHPRHDAYGSTARVRMRYRFDCPTGVGAPGAGARVLAK
jgi:hypothetical protein